MKKLLPLLPLVLGSFPLFAGSLADALPENAVFMLQVENVQEAREQYKASPLADALKDMDMTKLMMSMVNQGMENGEVDLPADLSPDEFEAQFTKYTGMMKGISEHLTGEMVMGLGSLENAINTFKEVSEIRDALYEEVEFDKDDEDAGDMEAIAKQEEEFETREMFAVFNEFYFLAEVKEGEALLTKIENMITESLQESEDETSEVKMETADWDGLKVYSLQGRDVDPDLEEDEQADFIGFSWWTVKNNVWVSRGTEEALRQTLQALDQAPAERLSASPGYVDAMQYLGEQDTKVYMDFSRIDPLIRLIAGDEMMNTDMQQGLTPKKIMDWLGADALLPYVVGFSIRAEGIEGKARFGFTRETGLSRMLIDPSEDPAPTPAFLHKNMGQVSSMRWGLGDAIRRIEKEIGTLQPEFTAVLGMGKAMMIGQLGMDVQTQFLDHFGSGLVMVQELDKEVMEQMLEMAEEEDPMKQLEFRMQHPTNGQNYLMALELKNPETVMSGLNTLLSRVHPEGMPEPKMFQGHAIHSPMPGAEDSPMANLVTYAVLDGYLVVSIGSEKMLQDAIRASNEPASRLIQDPAFQAMRDTLPEGVMFEYTPRSVQQNAWSIIESSLQAAGVELEGLPDFEKLGAVFGDSFSSATRKGTVFEAEVRSSFVDPAE